jgi:hypothetical protein
MEDLRPAGFLGCAFGQRMAQFFQLQANPDEWSDLELLSTLTAFGSDLPGNFILGDGRALSDFQEHKIATAEGCYRHTKPDCYPALAQQVLEHCEDYGSSAGGEQPKFTTLACDSPKTQPRAVIVKRALDAAHLRMGDGSWADCARMLHKTQRISAVDREHEASPLLWEAHCQY